MNRPFLRSSVAVIAAAWASLTLAACSKPAVEEVATEAAVSVQVAPVKLDTIKASITVTGTVSPSPGGDSTIVAPEAGRIAELPKAEGDAVKEGDLLARFEIPSLQAESAAAQSAVSQAAARLQAATAAVTRLTGLVERGIAPQKDLDEATREQQEAQADVRRADSAKAAADLLASHAVIRARFAGVVARRWHNPGDQVEASASDPVLRVIDPARLEVVAAVPASALSMIVPGHAATVFNPADGGAIAGTVINRPAAVDGAAATGDVRVSLGAGAPALAVGTPVQLEITGDERTAVLVVPTSAVRREEDVTFVMTAGDDGKAHKKNVKIGISTRDVSQVLSGLTAGEQVIVGPGDPVPDGAAITIVK